jgi:hypothetical protein
MINNKESTRSIILRIFSEELPEAKLDELPEDTKRIVCSVKI